MASDRDTRRVNAWLQTESNRFIASSTLTQDLTRRYEQLERIPGTLISTGLDKIKEVCGEKEKLLQQAIDEEEAARKVDAAYTMNPVQILMWAGFRGGETA